MDETCKHLQNRVDCAHDSYEITDCCHSVS
jgi:hypothetical protein